MGQVASRKKSTKKFTLAVLFAIVSVCFLTVLTTGAVSMYLEENLKTEAAAANAKATEAPKTLSAIISYVEEYKQTHNGHWPTQYCDNESLDGEWIDKIAGNKSKYFTFFYSVDFAGNIYAGAEGKAEPFSSKDTLTFYFVKASALTNTWQATGKLTNIKPN